jgi:hypothetical protein
MARESISGLIRGDHPILNDPELISALADYVEDTYRPYNTPSFTPSTIYVETTGNDDTGDGSSGNPFATVEKAMQLIGINNGSAVTIQLGTGTFGLPTILTQMNYITIQGTESDEETRNITTVHHATEDELVSVTVDGAALSNNEWRGRMIRYDGGAANGRIGWVWRNTGNRLWINQGTNLAIAAPTTADDITLISQNTTINLDNTVVALGSVQLNIYNLKFTGNKVFFFLATDKVEIKECHSHINRFQSGGFGRAFASNCYIANIGNASRGFHTLTNDGFNRWDQGTVFDTENCVANADYIPIQIGAKVNSLGRIVFRGLGSNGIFIEGGTVFNGDGIGDEDIWLFENGSGTVSASNTEAVLVNVNDKLLGGAVFLPHLYGEVTSDYVVKAKRAALVEIGANSSVTTATNTNAVSADGGTSEVAYAADGTIITNGSVPSHLYDEKGSDVASASSLTLGAGKSFDITGTTTVNNIAVLGWAEGARIRLKFDGSLTVTDQAGGSGQLRLAGSGNLSATANDTLTLELDGTDWFEIARTVI